MPGDAPLFPGAKLKVKRAEHHIGQLVTILRTFLQTDFYRLGIEENAEAGLNVLKLEVTKPLPDDIALIVGDCAHNLRSALDHLAFDIVTRGGGTPDTHTSFPIRINQQEVIGALKGEEKRTGTDIGADIVDLIVKTIQPYDGANNALWPLHRLDIIDKHRMLIPMVSVTELRDVRAEDENRNTFQIARMIVGGKGELRAVASSAKMHIKSHGQPAFDVIFQRGEVFEGQPIVPTLYQLAQLISGIIQTIEQAYLARS